MRWILTRNTCFVCSKDKKSVVLFGNLPPIPQILPPILISISRFWSLVFLKISRQRNLDFCGWSSTATVDGWTSSLVSVSNATAANDKDSAIPGVSRDQFLYFIPSSKYFDGWRTRLLMWSDGAWSKTSPTANNNHVYQCREKKC